MDFVEVFSSSAIYFSSYKMLCTLSSSSSVSTCPDSNTISNKIYNLSFMLFFHSFKWIIKELVYIFDKEQDPCVA